MVSPSACETAGGLMATRKSRGLVSQTQEQLCPGDEGQAERREQERRVSWQLTLVTAEGRRRSCSYRRHGRGLSPALPHCEGAPARGRGAAARGHPAWHSARGDLVDAPQTSQQAVVRVARRRDHLEHGLKGPAVQLAFHLVSVEVRGHQAEQVDVHLI